MNIQRYDIVNALRDTLYPSPFVHAMWLEGADANDAVDEFSDIDICVDIDDRFEEEAIRLVERSLEAISSIDYQYTMHHLHPKLRQRIYHLTGTGPYLMVDFCWQLHSRDPKESCFIRGSKIEAPLILFDKSGVISFRDLDIGEFYHDNRDRFNECLYRYSQHARVIKYCYRGQYLEAYAYYNKYVLEPMINLLRIIYTPANADYYLIHISSHIPRDCVGELEYFAQISSTEDILCRLGKAKEWFDQLCEQAETKYGFLRDKDQCSQPD